MAEERLLRLLPPQVRLLRRPQRPRQRVAAAALLLGAQPRRYVRLLPVAAHLLILLSVFWWTIRDLWGVSHQIDHFQCASKSDIYISPDPSGRLVGGPWEVIDIGLPASFSLRPFQTLPVAQLAYGRSFRLARLRRRRAQRLLLPPLFLPPYQRELTRAVSRPSKFLVQEPL